MHIFNMSVTYLQSIKRMLLKLQEKLISQSMHYQHCGKHLTVKITKWHNSCNTDPSAPIFLQNVQCLMVRCGENWNKFRQELLKLQSKTFKCGQKDGRRTG